MFRFLVFVALAAVVLVEAACNYEETEQVVAQLHEKMTGSAKKIRPPGVQTNVTVNYYIRKIVSIDEEAHTWRVQLTFRQEWTDSRLAFTPKGDLPYVTLGCIKDIWVPDLFFKEEVDSHIHATMQPDDLIRISPDGHVLWSRRVTLELFCPANFKNSTFICPLTVASYKYTKTELDIFWKAEDPIQQSADAVLLKEFSLKDHTTKTCEGKTVVGTWACITAHFTFGHSMCEA